MELRSHVAGGPGSGKGVEAEANEWVGNLEAELVDQFGALVHWVTLPSIGPAKEPVKLPHDETGSPIDDLVLQGEGSDRHLNAKSTPAPHGGTPAPNGFTAQHGVEPALHQCEVGQGLLDP